MSSRGKYDTNPLDEGVARRADRERGTRRAEEDSGAGRITSPPQPAESRPVDLSLGDAPTRRYDRTDTNSYPSVFVPPVYQPPAVSSPGPPQSIRNQGMNNVVAGLGISNKFAQALPYAPAYIGLVASIVELLVVPRSEGHVRFHASQGMALHLAIIAIGILFSIIGAITGNHAGGSLFWLASTIFLVVSMIRAYKGEGYQITPLEDAARFINQHLAPKR